MKLTIRKDKGGKQRERSFAAMNEEMMLTPYPTSPDDKECGVEMSEEQAEELCGWLVQKLWNVRLSKVNP